MATDRAVRDADAPADSPEPDAQRRTVMAAIGRLIYEGHQRLIAGSKTTANGPGAKGEKDDG